MTTSKEVGPLAFLEDELAALARADLLRVPPDRQPGMVDLCSNDYLGYAREPWPSDEGASGSGGSRLVTGDHAAHAGAERVIADWLGTESALLFTSGYAANVGTLSSLARPGDLVVSDRLNHASLIDGCRLSGATVKIYPHLAVDHVEEILRSTPARGRRWLVTESYFSMDGDGPDLGRLRAVCDRYGAALIVDEAHAIGVFGPSGRGVAASASVKPDVLIGMGGKALGLQGAFVAGSAVLRQWLWNRARSFVFSTGIAPTLAAAFALRVGRARADDERRERLRVVSRTLREVFAEVGAVVGGVEDGPILPWVIGEADKALKIAAALRRDGIHVQAIRPPTVPEGGARLRVTAHALLTEEDIVRVRDALGRARRSGCFT